MTKFTFRLYEHLKNKQLKHTAFYFKIHVQLYTNLRLSTYINSSQCKLLLVRKYYVHVLHC